MSDCFPCFIIALGLTALGIFITRQWIGRRK